MKKFDDFLACLFICSLCNIFAYGSAYAYRTYEFIWKLAYYQNKFAQKTDLNNAKIVDRVQTNTAQYLPTWVSQYEKKSSGFHRRLTLHTDSQWCPNRAG